MNKSDLLFIATRVSTIKKFYSELIELLLFHEYRINIAGNFEESNEDVKFEKLNSNNIHKLNINRKLISFDNIFSIVGIYNLILKMKPRIIIVTTPIAAALLRICPINFDKLKICIIYAAHGFHFYNGSPKFNWAVYFQIEYVLSRRTNCIITTNNEDYLLATKYFKSSQIHKINGVGLDFGKFNNNKKTDYVSRIIGTDHNEKIIISVGELNSNKNHISLIPYLSKEVFNNIQYVICGTGKLAEFISDYASKYGVSDRVYLLGYRDDVHQLLSGSDLFFFPSIREGFGMSLIEAIAMNKDFVASKIRGVIDIVPLEVQENHLFEVGDDDRMIGLISDKLIAGNVSDVSKYLNEDISIDTVNNEYLKIIRKIDNDQNK